MALCLCTILATHYKDIKHTHTHTHTHTARAHPLTLRVHALGWWARLPPKPASHTTVTPRIPVTKCDTHAARHKICTTKHSKGSVSCRNKELQRKNMTGRGQGGKTAKKPNNINIKTKTHKHTYAA